MRMIHAKAIAGGIDNLPIANGSQDVVFAARTTHVLTVSVN